MPSKEELLALVINWLADCQFVDTPNCYQKPYYSYPKEYFYRIINELNLWNDIQLLVDQYHLVVLLQALEEVVESASSDFEFNTPNLGTLLEVYEIIACLVKLMQKRI
jgi:hypothetical protein